MSFTPREFVAVREFLASEGLSSATVTETIQLCEAGIGSDLLNKERENARRKVNLDDAQNASERLTSLLTQREPGLASWNVAVQEVYDQLSAALGVTR